MSGDANALTTKLLELRTIFLAQFPARIEEARGGLSGLYEGPGSEGVETLHSVLHAIKGTSDSLGLVELGDLARETEALIDRAASSSGQNILALRKALAGRLEALEAAAAAAREHESRPQPTSKDEEPASDEGLPEELPLVYLCDDDEILAAVISSQISYFGYKVEVFTKTSDLVEAALAKKPRALIMDIVFPEGDMGGSMALERIRERGIDIPSVFISARGDFAARLGAVRAGGSAFFTKPIDAMKLVATLDELTRLREPEPFRILIVDDEPVAAEYHRVILGAAGMAVRATDDPEQALGIVREFRPDLVLMDMYMPTCSGHDLAALIRQVPDFLSVPIIFLSAETDKAKQLSAMSVGADGFLTKPISREELVASVSLRAERMRLLRSLMTQDSLTGLFNHTTTTQMLKTSLDGAQRTNLSLCFAMIDIDNFKKVNDSYGHPVGDQVLIAIARALRQRLRTSDIVGRYGGEEFAVILPNTSRESARLILDMLRHDFSRVEFLSGDRVFHCSFSCGIATSLDYPTFQALREAADRSLYQAKAAGKNQVCVATPDRMQREGPDGR